MNTPLIEAVLVVLREVLEFALLVGILLAAGAGTDRRDDGNEIRLRDHVDDVRVTDGRCGACFVAESFQQVLLPVGRPLLLTVNVSGRELVVPGYTETPLTTAIASDPVRALVVQAFVGMTAVMALALALGRDLVPLAVARPRAGRVLTGLRL